ncbi:hypothetical protein [Candidatus Odyssella thessalonicensis]|uniref:hypothetical protein n=1 Tax=Candidatus Odyssella thessalonicensis TaxID=84647 RepID=UPI0002F4B0D2|nr:hypothetical protein [Candidatus Odyssella thessalonicensis]
MIKYNWFMMSPFLEAYDLFIPLPNHTLFWRAFEIQKNGNLDYNPVEHYIKERRGEEAVKEDFDFPFVAYGRSRFEFSPLSEQLQ